MRKAVIVVFMFSLISLFTACKGKESKTVYAYGESSLTEAFSLEKMAVYQDRAELYFENASFDTISKVFCYDKDFKYLEEAEIDFNKGVLTLKSSDPAKISGIALYVSSDYYFKIRYLDSDQYAVLTYEFVSDIGFEEFGDRKAYYTDEELKKEKEDEQAEYESDRKVFDYLEGNWVSEDGNSRKYFYEENGKFYADVTAYDTETKESITYTMSFENPSFDYDYDFEDTDAHEEPVRISMVSGDSMTSFVLSEDFSCLQVDYEEGIRFYKQ